MQNSLYKRDVTSFFYGNSAYVIFGVYVLLSMILAFFWGMYFFDDNSSMMSFFAYQPQVMVMIVPAITMRCWAEERRSGTIENLLTFPLSAWNLMFSKFAAAFTIVMIMLLFSIPLLLTTIGYVKVDFENVLSAYAGLIGMAMVLTAGGCLVSSIAGIPMAAYLLGLLFGALWVNLNFGNIITSVWKNAPLYFDGVLNFDANYQNFLNGQISPASLFYFLSLSALLLLFNWLVVSDWRAK